MEDMIAVAAKLPWWVGVGIALAAYAILHIVASQAPAAAPTSVAHLGQYAMRTAFVTLAGYGQWLLPIPFLIGAAISAIQRRKRQALHEQIAVASDCAAALEGVSWQQFEQLVGEAFRRRGFAVVETGGGGADGGVDLVLTQTGERYLVQCKQWKALQVGVPVVRELYGVMAARGATGGFVVTSGKFSAEAVAFAQGRNIELFDGTRLAAMIRSAKTSVPAGILTVSAPPVVAAPEPDATGVPTCPRCGAPMIKRVAKQGANAGKPFWGCSGFPACRGIRAIS